MKVLALIPYPIELGPSQRYRLKLFLNDFSKNGYYFETRSFYSEEAYNTLYVKGKFLKKVGFILSGFFRRITDLFAAKEFDIIFVQREITPVGPPIFAWLLCKVFKKKIIFDFDDAIWIKNYSENNALFHRLKCYWKTDYFIKWSSKVFAGNSYLLEYAKKINKNSLLIPTVVDTELIHCPDLYSRDKASVPVIGWTGSVSTLHFLEVVYPILDELHNEYDFILKVISNEAPKYNPSYLKFIKWNPTTEISDLFKIDLGIMPLKDDFDFAKGKCGFKLIQYMALEKTVIASGIGVNNEIIEDGITGYICNTPKCWKQRIELFLKGDLLPTGSLSRAKINDKYSRRSVIGKIMKSFDETLIRF